MAQARTRRLCQHACSRSILLLHWCLLFRFSSSLPSPSRKRYWECDLFLANIIMHASICASGTKDELGWAGAHIALFRIVLVSVLRMISKAHTHTHTHTHTQTHKTNIYIYTVQISWLLTDLQLLIEMYLGNKNCDGHSHDSQTIAERSSTFNKTSLININHLHNDAV